MGLLLCGMEYIIWTGFFGGNALNNVCILLGINTNLSLSLIFIFWSSTVKPRKLSCGRWSYMSRDKKNSMQSANVNVNKQVSEREIRITSIRETRGFGSLFKVHILFIFDLTYFIIRLLCILRLEPFSIISNFNDFTAGNTTVFVCQRHHSLPQNQNSWFSCKCESTLYPPHLDFTNICSQFSYIIQMHSTVLIEIDSLYLFLAEVHRRFIIIAVTMRISIIRQRIKNNK